MLRGLDQEIRELLPEWDPAAWAREGLQLDLSGMAGRLLRLLWGEVVASFNLLGKLLVLAVIAAVLSRFQQAWNRESVGRLAENVIYLVLMGLVIQSFHFILNLARGSLDRAAEFVYALLPGFFALLTAAGGLTLTSICHPVVWTGIGLVVGAIKDLIFPMIYFAGIPGLSRCWWRALPEQTGGTRLEAGHRTGAPGRPFPGVVTVQGISVAVAEGVGLRAAKFVTGTLSPWSGTLAEGIGGRMFAVDQKRARSFWRSCRRPDPPAPAKVLAVALIYYLASALVQPAGRNGWPRFA